MPYFSLIQFLQRHLHVQQLFRPIYTPLSAYHMPHSFIIFFTIVIFPFIVNQYTFYMIPSHCLFHHVQAFIETLISRPSGNRSTSGLPAYLYKFSASLSSRQRRRNLSVSKAIFFSHFLFFFGTGSSSYIASSKSRRNSLFSTSSTSSISFAPS